jgi:hypothetical protein
MRKSHRIQIILVLSAIIFGSFAVKGNWLQFEVRGTVFNATTKKPMGGIFVVAAYYETKGGAFGPSSTKCVGTKGMNTGKDGVYNFPSGNSGVLRIYATSIDHYQNDEMAVAEKYSETGKGGRGSENIYMSPLNTKTVQELRLIDCDDGDVSAYADYLRIILEAEKKYGDLPHRIDIATRMLESAQSKSEKLKTK